MFSSMFGRPKLLVAKRVLSGPRFFPTANSEVKKLTIRNTFKDNPSAKYWLLAAFTVTAGVTYYIYKNQTKKKVILNLLPPRPNHYCIPLPEEIDKLRSILEHTSYNSTVKQVQISGHPASGKTQLARLLAEYLNESRRNSFYFKMWPKDEVTITLHANSQESLLSSLKQVASRLGCKDEDVHWDSKDLAAQLDVFSHVVQEKLKQASQWIVIIDNHDPGKQLTKWLPNPGWGNGYVIHTINSENYINITKQESQYADLYLNGMSFESALQLFAGVVHATGNQSVSKELCNDLIHLLCHDPLSVVYAAVYFKYKAEQNEDYSYQNLYAELYQTIEQLHQENPNSSMLQLVQTSAVILAAKMIGEISPKLQHVFDFLGSCNPNQPVPISVFSHHLKIPEYHIQLESSSNQDEKVTPSHDEASLAISLEHEPNLWSFRGVLDRILNVYERVKLEVDALKGLFGYGNVTVGGSQSKLPSDELDDIRSCPLLLKFREPLADTEVVMVHPIVHNVFRQMFLGVTVPLLEHQHLVLAERKHQRKSIFGRLKGFDSKLTIAEYRKRLGDNVRSGETNVQKILDLKRTGLSITSVVRNINNEDTDDKTQHQNAVGHYQEHLKRVVHSLANYYRLSGDDKSGVVARAMLLPHLQAILDEVWLAAASKAEVFRTLAKIHALLFGDFHTSKRLLDEAYEVYRKRLGEDSLEIAAVLTEQAELCDTSAEILKCKLLLERAVEIYQKNIKSSQTNKQPFEYGKALVALGVICGDLGEPNQSKELLEKGLMELQNAAPDEPQAKHNRWFAAEISSAVTNLGHAYLSLGKISQGRKLLELALIGHQNVRGDTHHEVMRTLTTLSIAHAMQGNNQESKRLRNEAGKIKKKIETSTPLFFK